MLAPNTVIQAAGWVRNTGPFFLLKVSSVPKTGATDEG